MLKKNGRLMAALACNVVEGLLSGSVFAVLIVSLEALFSKTLQLQNLAALSGILCGVFLLRFVVYAYGYTTGHLAGAQIARDLRLFLGEKLKRMRLSSLVREKPGYYLTVITQDVTNYEAVLTHKTGDVVKNSVLFLLLISFLFVTHPLIGLMNLLLTVLAAPAIWFSFRAVQTYGGRKKEILAENVSDLVEYIAGIQTLRSYGLGGDKNKKVKDSLKKISDISYRFEAKIIPIGTIFNVLTGVGLPFSMLIAGNEWLQGEISSTALAICVLAPLQLSQMAAALFVDLTAYRNLKVAKTSINALLKAQEEPIEKADFVPEDYTIHFDKVSFGYDSSGKVLDEVSFEAKCGALTALVGSSGAGKSTVLHLLSKYYEPQSGRIQIGGVDIAVVSAGDVLGKLSIVYQETFLFNDTIQNNIRLAKKDAAAEQVRQACFAAQCEAFIQCLEQGYDTLAGENGNTLSGGERQRIAIARALLKDSPVLLLDEATASLDIENEAAVRKAIYHLLEQKKTVIMVAHNLSLIQQAQQILVLDQGRIVERGTHAELLKKQGKYQAMWAAQYPENRCCL